MMQAAHAALEPPASISHPDALLVLMSGRSTASATIPFSSPTLKRPRVARPSTLEAPGLAVTACAALLEPRARHMRSVAVSGMPSLPHIHVLTPMGGMWS